MVLRAYPFAGIDDKEHHVGFGDGLTGLLAHLLQNATACIGFEPAGVNHDVLVWPLFSLAVVAVPRQSGEVGNDGVARLGHPVEQCRFTHVGTANQGQNGFHRSLRTGSAQLTPDGSRRRHRCV